MCEKRDVCVLSHSRANIANMNYSSDLGVSTFNVDGNLRHGDDKASNSTSLDTGTVAPKLDNGEAVSSFVTPTSSSEASSSLRLMAPQPSGSKSSWRVRRWCAAIMQTQLFERAIILAIVANCITLALFNPLDKDCLTEQCQVLEAFEYFFAVFFAIEATIRIMAQGLRGSGSYFTDVWNKLDFFIVVMGLIDIAGLIDGRTLSIIRTARVLRPLRILNRLLSTSTSDADFHSFIFPERMHAC